MELQHFSHDHPLILNHQAKDGHSGINCNGCLRPLSGDTYECRQCEFVLHKSCVELPKQIIHFFHPQHPLTLLSKSPYGVGQRFYCDYCKERVWGFTYHCSICGYDLDMKCVLLREIVNHEGHQHSFTLHRPTSFTCDVCAETSNGMCYMCSTCQLWVHKHCVALPISDSIHTLNLPSTFPTVVEDLQESRDAVSGEEHAVSLITSDVNKISLEENDMLSMIQHFSHRCQLILTNDEPQNEETSDELENEEICDEPQNAEICNGCVRPISSPFYKCASCKFFLHPRCTQLPTTIRSILHPHPLTIRVQSSSYTVDLFFCSTCDDRICTGFAYECKICNFVIDARCASISKNTLKHDGHDHILSLVQKMSESNCSACGRICCTKFSCEDCDFNLDLRCALLPLTARHRWDEKHPLKLTYVNVEHISKFYFCDLCEEVRNPDDWYYCCKECDLSAHTSCLFGKHDIKYGAIYFFKSLHYHNLKLLAENSWHKCLCKSEGSTDNKDVVLECPTCDHTHVNLDDLLSGEFPIVVEDLQESGDAASQEEQAVSLITSDVSKISLEENEMLSTIQHFSHSYQLILTNDEPQNEEICNGCVRPISAPFYKCAECKFFLHPRCTQLPTTIRSILHPHPLTLRVRSSFYTENLFKCSICDKLCTGFGYECKLCRFRIDARCASISTSTLKHDGHEHILSLVQKFSNSNCSSCGSICRTKFSCEDCDFNIDLRCALLPLTARLGWDEEKHPLKLTFVNVENTAKFYFCDLCEEVRNPDDWYYCCKECDRSAHTACLFGKHDVKFGCATYPFKKLHDHLLEVLAEKSKNKYGCKSECDTENKDVVLECPTCDYHTHVNFQEFWLQQGM